MVEISLEEFQRSQSVRIAQDIIEQSEEHEQKMQTNWEKSWLNSHQHLVALLRFLDKDFDEACEKSNHPLDKFEDNDLAYLVHVRIRAMMDEVNRKERVHKESELLQQVNGLAKKTVELERTNTSLVEDNKKLIAEISNLNAHLVALRQAQKEITPIEAMNFTEISSNTAPNIGAQAPDWVSNWKCSKAFEKMAMAILVMGETGMSLRPSIIKEMSKRLSLSPDNNSLDEAVSRLLSDEENLHPILISKVAEIPEEGASSGGNHPDVLRLTEDGRSAYQVLTGKVPKENDYDRLIRCHSSPDHTILNIQAVEFLVEAGYRIKGQAQKIQLSNGSTFVPDITAVDPSTGDLIFVEVERDVHKDQAGRKQKWLNIYEATNGNLYVFCDNLTCQRSIQGEINIALGSLKFNSSLTNLHGLRSGKRSKLNGSIWLTSNQGK